MLGVCPVDRCRLSGALHFSRKVLSRLPRLRLPCWMLHSHARFGPRTTAHTVHATAPKMRPHCGEDMSQLSLAIKRRRKTQWPFTVHLPLAQCYIPTSVARSR